MSFIKSEKTTTIHEKPDGSMETTSTEKTSSISRNAEPDYVKLYTAMWCEFNAIPEAYRGLFLELVCRMSYCNAADLGGSQLVNTGKPWAEAIMKSLNWKKSMYMKGLSVLCDCGAIRKVGRGVYQINPSYASKGEWKYNPRLERGGVEDLVATFDFAKGTVDAKIVWAATGEADPEAGLRKGESVVAKRVSFTPAPETESGIPGQMTVYDLDLETLPL